VSEPAIDLFKIRDHVADFEDFVAEYRRRSATTLARPACRRNIAFGPGSADLFDITVPDTPSDNPRPIHMFIHGGYWRAFSKEDYAFVADAIVAAGAIAVVLDYSLMPHGPMATLGYQGRRAARWL